MTRTNNITYDKVLKRIKTYIEDKKELDLVKRAYEFARDKHEGQYRKTGEPYITHPLSVAMILTEIYADAETLSAGLLHDVLEDCDCTEEEMTNEFGSTITRIVQGVTKLSRIHFSTENDYLIEYYKKIIVGMSEDVRVIIVKLADRLHNLRTLWALPKEKQKEKAHEALDILAPIGDHLGIHRIKSELEDLSLRYLKPDVYYDIAEHLNQTKMDREHTVQEMLNEVTELLTEHHIPHEIKGRAKSIYSIYHKLQNGKTFNTIYDLLGLRILVNTEQECYVALGLIHSKFRPMSHRFKDYIAMPKPNMYQSLHTTIFGIDGYLFEIQIRTYEMDEVAENGIASHWSYKENNGSEKNANLTNTTQQKLQFFKSIIDLSQENLSSEDFVNSVKNEVLNNNIYCYTPKGDVIELPKGSSPIDFAYKIHTKVGETMVGAIVNDQIVPLDYELQNNDIVKINTNKSAKPSREWLNIAKNTTTRNKIKNYFTKSERDIYIEKGKYLIEKALRKRKLVINEFFQEENIQAIHKEYKEIDNIEDIYLNIGNDKIPANSIINVIHKDEDNIPKPRIITKKQKSSTPDIIVSGIDKVKVNLARCCYPVYGDSIIGYITKGNGIRVHRMNCHNLEELDDRTVEVKWNQNVNKKYLSCLLIYSNSSENHLSDITNALSTVNVGIEESRILNKNKYIYEITIYVSSLDQLDKIIIMLNNNDYIDNVEREFL